MSIFDLGPLRGLGLIGTELAREREAGEQGVLPDSWGNAPDTLESPRAAWQPADRTMLVTNETNGVLRVPLGRGKVLHLGPRQSGHVLRSATERPAFLRMVERKLISVRSEAEIPGSETGGTGVGEENGTQPSRIQRKGLR